MNKIQEEWKRLQPKEEKATGSKTDEGKPQLNLLDKYALEEMAKVRMFGAEKYGRFNWRGGFKYSRLIDAAMRHILAFNDGVDKDPDSGLSPIAHAATTLMFLLRMIKDRSDLDDRYKKSDEHTLKE